MKRFVFLLFIGVFASCGNDKEKEARIKELEKTISTLEKKNSQIECDLQLTRDSLDLLKFPADQRLHEIDILIQENKFDEARLRIKDLQLIFPHSHEASQCETLLENIQELEQKAIEEENRIKALGFKALVQQTSFTIDYNKVVLSDVKVGTTYTFDDYGSEYFYRTAERGTKYVLATMSVTSADKDPKLPQLAVYKINGDKMEFVDVLETRFARWKDYGSYLGNYTDYGNDFAHTGTIKFKLALQVDVDILNGPYAIVCKNENTITRSYERFNNPPVSYDSDKYCYADILNADSFKDQYILVKVYNIQ